MKKIFPPKRKRLLIPSVLSFLLLAAACSNNNDAGTAPSPVKPADSTSNERLKLSIMYNFDGVVFPPEGNPVQKKIEELTNTQLSIQQLPGSAFEEKLPVLIASGELPDAIPIPRRHQKLPYVVNAVNANMFWEIGPYLKQFPNLSSINPIIYENIAYDGKTYGLPRVRPMARRAFQYRQDWLENLGMKEPKTVDEFYEMLRAFTKDDPDKNGKNDTFGLTSKEVGFWFASFFGAPNKWKIQDGKFIRDVQTEQFLNALKFEKKLYEEGLMNRDFSVIDRPKWTGAIETGKAGVRIDVTGSSVGLDDTVKKNNGAKAAVSFFSILEKEQGKKVFLEGGHNGFFLFPKSSVKTEAHLLKVLKFFDTLAGEQASSLFTWGLEGTHYKLENGKPVWVDFKGFSDNVSSAYGAPLATQTPAVKALKGDMNRLQELEAKITAENEKYLVTDPTLPLISQTFAEKGAQLETILEDANIKFVMAGSEEQWRKDVQTWRTRGGDQIAKEYEEANAKIKKK